MITTLDKNTALILIDLQKGVAGLPTAHTMGTILNNSAKLVAAFRKANLPIVIVNVNPAGAAWTKTRKEPNPVPNRAFKEDWLEIVPEIQTQPGDIFITKHTWGAFFETKLHEALQEKNVTGIVIAGVATSIGVEGTARQASELGYNISFVKDAMTDMFPEAHDNSLKHIFPRMGEIGDTVDVIEKLA
ncbi:cysteine hydrolase family protein [Ferruginibacter albus]|uniref:cysteine hydrolase family protein n=1 Tax=Ferruginibacter albus TaxID=2875540 RepID=UPI001CC592CD|nr:isochorismatase family protein [Ferruginibacter albus]UAY51384.1 isochorismatase family protein [Ferruginibacter albus]